MTSGGKKRFIRRMFDDIYLRYDLLNAILSAGMDNRWRKKTIDEITAEGVVIDLCGGGGQLARQLLDRRDFRGHVIIADISVRMILLSRRILDPAGYGHRYHAVVCDVECLPFKAGVFSGAVSAFSLRNLDDLSAFSDEARRVLKKGGRARLLEIGHPRGRILKALFGFYFYRLGPRIAGLFTDRKYAYDYLPVSLRVFPSQNEILRILSAGWHDSDILEMWKGITVIYRLSKGKDGTG